MSARRIAIITGFALAAGLLWTARAQFGPGFGGGGGGGGFRSRMRFGEQPSSPEELREAQEMDNALKPGFKDDVFTFARLKFDVDYGTGFRSWDDDSPEADLNSIYRLYQVTSMTVRPGTHYIDITPDELAKYPFVYAANGGRMDLTDDQVTALRNYLLNGGFLMVDDFWGDSQWEHLYNQMKRIFPDREPEEVTIDHRVFHTVFNFTQLPQIPSVGAFFRSGQSYDAGFDYYNRSHGPHYYGIYDSKQHMMVLICHNNHYGDGWEHESDDQTYFNKFSEPMGYPMLINIIYYAATH